jgi:hypothetical protein
MLVLNCSFLNRGYSLMNVVKMLASIVAMCSLDVIFLSKITLRYFTLITNGMSRPFYLRRESGDLISMRKVDRPTVLLFLREWMLRPTASSVVVRVPGYRSRGLGLIPGATIFSEK